jgi:Zn finger protein HypA/HybF involved in hydrogenase expression
MKPPKETRRVEGRGRPEDGLSERTEDRTQSRSLLPSALARVHEAASRDKKARFTALLHHVNVEALGRAFGRLKRGAAAGVDGETVATYERVCRRSCRPCATACTADAPGRSRCAACTSPNPTVVSDPVRCRNVVTLRGSTHVCARIHNARDAVDASDAVAPCPLLPAGMR